ncbi:hypothetical protein PIROE2DRAFT_18762 [Piromyces sp. E2]|nr:hypothetical protein PIROE2DRAFT_18762 [Piromyces sp. E2]|eukprot:OUM56575.1 hypothetical protein PIROE2DRAFT_18762 [Piromyces sp. E2]
MKQKILIIILFFVSSIICSKKKRDIPICKTCTITAVNGNKKLGLENNKTCMIDEILCKDYLDAEYCVGYTVAFKYMDTSYGVENNKTCIINPITEHYSLCNHCTIKLEEKEFSWGYDDNDKVIR